MSVCVDASFGIALVLPEEKSDAAAALWDNWKRRGEAILSPSLFFFETRSVLRNRVWRNMLSRGDALIALEGLDALGVELVHPKDLAGTAWEIASQAERPALYDSFYMATALLNSCDLWTLDTRMTGTRRKSFSFVRTV